MVLDLCSTHRRAAIINKPANHLTQIIACLFVCSGAFLTSASAAAEEEDQDEILEMEEITVTASRRDESLQDVAIAVAVVDVNEFIDAGLSNLSDILPFVPGVSVVGSGGNFGNQVYVRGINAVLAAGVTSYVDEIPIGSSTVYTTPAPLDGTLLDLGNLEVLKGPQGTLYGSSSLGGLLKFNTREASLTDWTGSLSADLSDTHGGGLNQLYRVNGNGPIVEDSLGLSFTAFWNDKTGYIDNVSIPKKGWDDYEYYGGSGSLRWAATDKLEFTLQGLYQKSTQDGLATIQANYADDQLMPGIAAGQPWFGEYETGEALINPSEFKADMLGLTIDYELGFGTLTSVTSTQSEMFTQSQDLTVPFAAYADLFFPENAPHTSAIFVGDLGFDKFTQELRLTSTANQHFEWIVGAFYTSEDGHNTQYLDVTPPAPLFYANFPSNYKELSLYGTGTYFFTPDFDASVGVRWSDYSNDVELVAEGPLVAPLPQTNIDDNVTNWLFNLRYRPSDTMALYGRIASGYRPGGANFLILDPEGAPLSLPYFDPDSLWSYEIGFKGTSDDGRFGYDLAAFYIDWQDYQIRLTRGGVSVAGNAAKASSKGIETSLSYAATEALVFTGSFSYVDAKLGADEPDLGGADGDQLPDSPKWQFVLDAQYNFSLGNFPAYAGAAWRYKGSMPVGFDGYTDSNGMYWPPSNPRLELDSFSLVDLRAGFSTHNFDFSLYVTNLLDEWAYVSFASFFDSPSLGTPTRPRTIGAVVRWNFR